MSHPRTDRARELTAELAAAGVRATCDVRTVNPPCVLVEPVPGIVWRGTLGGDPALTWTVVALVPYPGTLAAADALDALVDTVAGVLDLDSATPGTYQTGFAPDPLPAYVMTLTEL
jgi:hypothetical protein